MANQSETNFTDLVSLAQENSESRQGILSVKNNLDF